MAPERRAVAARHARLALHKFMGFSIQSRGNMLNAVSKPARPLDVSALALPENTQRFLWLGNIIDDNFPGEGSNYFSISMCYEVSKAPNIVPWILRKSSSSRLRRLKETHLILFNALAECRMHMLGRVGDNLNISPELFFELKGEFV